MGNYKLRGSEFLVNKTPENDQLQPQIAPLSGGGFVAIWLNFNTINRSGPSAITSLARCQVFDANSKPVGPELSININNDENANPQLGVKELTDGRILLFWDEFRKPDSSGHAKSQIAGQILTLNKRPTLSSRLPISSGLDYDTLPAAAALQNGSYILAWSHKSISGETSFRSINAQAFAADGSRIGDEFYIADPDSDPQSQPTLATLPDGGFVVAWAKEKNGSDDVMAQIFNADRSRRGNSFTVNSHTLMDQRQPSVTTLSDGRFVVAWSDFDRSNSGGGIRAQIFNANGSKASEELVVNSSEDNLSTQRPSITALADGGFAVAWMSLIPHDSDRSYDIRGQIFGPDGSKIGDEIPINTSTAGDQYNPAITSLTNGDLAVVWEDDGQRTTGPDTSGLSIRGQILAAEPKHYLTFSGGGWNTHSFLAGMFAGALDVMESRGSQPDSALNDLMTNVDGIAAISGGSWFLSHLAYSANFNQQFDSKAERNDYDTTGYNGALINTLAGLQNVEIESSIRTFLDATETKVGWKDTGIPYDSVAIVEYVAKLASFLQKSNLDWRDFVEQLVYGPLGMRDELANVTLEDARQPWAQNKDFVIATGISTSDTVLHPDPSSLISNLVLAHAEPTLAGAQARPLALRSEVSKEGIITASGDDPAGGDLILSYDNVLGTKSERVAIDVRGGIPLSPNLSIIDATVASSSALAAAAQPESFQPLLKNFLKKAKVPAALIPITASNIAKQLTSGLRFLSPLATFRKGQQTELDIPSTSPDGSDFDQQYQDSVQKGEVRLMDGGYLDNAPAAYMLRHIQEEQGVNQSFDLTLFFNSSIDPITGGVRMNVGQRGRKLSSYRLPNDLTQLFGRTLKQTWTTSGRTAKEAVAPAGTLVNGPFPKLQNRMPSAQIFNESAWRGKLVPEWQFLRGNLEIRYFDLDVTTVNNQQFGITGGQTGKVHIFACNNSDSFAAPVTEGILDEYKLNYTLARNAINEFGGAQPMLNALGVA